jgi:hypothetical protein
MSEKSERYFQFPLIALAFGSNPESRLQDIISYAVIDYGYKALDKMPSADRERLLRKIDKLHPPKPKTKRRSNLEYAAKYGAQMLNVTMRNQDRSIEQYHALRNFAHSVSAKFGDLPTVRIRTDIFWDADCGRITYPQFSVLAAIYSVIGNQPGAVRITRDTICIRALGYHTLEMAHELVKERTDPFPGLTTSQIRTTVDKLHELGFFARCHLGKKTRQTYYSHRMTNDELRKAVLKRKLYRREFKAEEARKNAETMDKLQERSEALDGVPSNRSADAPASPAQVGEPTATPTPIVPCPSLSHQFAEVLRSAEQQPRAASQAAPVQEMEPSSVDAVRDHFNSLVADGGRHAKAYVESRKWQNHEENWRKSSVRWLFDTLRKERTGAR